MKLKPKLFALILVPFVLVSCGELADSPMASDLEPSLAKGGGNPGKPGAGDGGKVATVALSGGYSTAVDQVVGLAEKGKEITFEATTENKIEYLLDLPPYGGDGICVASDLADGQTAAEFWNEFTASQNEVTSRSFRFNYRLDNKTEANRTEGFYVTNDGRGRWFKAGTTDALGLDVNSTITQSTDASGNDVYTLTGGALQVRFIDGGSVTCPNPVSFTLTAMN